MVKEFYDSGIILSKQKVREKDLLFTILTNSLGKVHAIVFSGATSRRRIGGKGEKYSEVEISFKKYSDYLSIEELKLVNPHEKILTDYSKIISAEIIIEIIIKSIPENREAGKVFNFLKNALNIIENGNETDLSKLLFELLQIEGYAMKPQFCSNCGKPLKEKAYFSLTEGFLCEKCAHKSASIYIIFNDQEISFLNGFGRETAGTISKLLKIWEEITNKDIVSAKLVIDRK